MSLRLLNPEEQRERLRNVREWSGISGRELSQRIGSYAEMLSKVETGKVQMVGTEIQKKIAIEVEGNGRLRQLDATTIFRYLQGEVDLDDTIRPKEAPRQDGADEDDATFMPGASLRLKGGPREETPARTGVSSELRGGPSGRKSPQMS